MLKGVKRMDGLTNFIDKLKYFEDTLGTDLKESKEWMD